MTTPRPMCSVRDCERPASIMDRASSRLWNYLTQYCSTCYEQLSQQNGSLTLDPARIVIEPAGGRGNGH